LNIWSLVEVPGLVVESVFEFRKLGETLPVDAQE
jgi:hypothetical protein